MLGVRLALAVVLLFAGACAWFGIAAGLGSDATTGVEGRPFIYWIMALSIGSCAAWAIPQLLSWFIPLRLPPWHDESGNFGKTRESLIEQLDGRTVMATASQLPAQERAGFAWQVLGRGLFLTVVSIPLSLFFGLAPIGTPALTPVESIPLAASLMLPAAYTITLVIRQRRKHTSPE
jgi:hypothetical protein